MSVTTGAKFSLGTLLSPKPHEIHHFRGVETVPELSSWISLNCGDPASSAPVCVAGNFGRTFILSQFSFALPNGIAGKFQAIMPAPAPGCFARNGVCTGPVFPSMSVVGPTMAHLEPQTTTTRQFDCCRARAHPIIPGCCAPVAGAVSSTTSKPAACSDLLYSSVTQACSSRTNATKGDCLPVRFLTVSLRTSVGN